MLTHATKCWFVIVLKLDSLYESQIVPRQSWPYDQGPDTTSHECRASELGEWLGATPRVVVVSAFILRLWFCQNVSLPVLCKMVRYYVCYFDI